MDHAADPLEVAEGILVLTSRTMHTTTTVLHDGRDAVLVDPTWHPDELAAIADLLESRSLRVVLGWATHAHHDHVLWHERFGTGPRLATTAAATSAVEHLDELRAAVEPNLRPLAGLVEGYDGAGLPWAGPVVEVVAHDAHAPGHGALWVPAVGALVAADMLSDVEIPLAGETGITAYAAGLERLAPYVEQAAVLIPGHGRVALSGPAGTADSPAARLRADRAYLAYLAYLAALAEPIGPAEGARDEDPRLATGPAWLREEHEANVRAARAAPASDGAPPR
ncbi:MBL fold metallo-hydrolase [Occultella glacieicola]|uniref:MBL fold metallo-hydrolase n=1 Tax=Occultella glacieicola TaxID=2518684 RepID=A0ABY2DYG3_9MICO|nr:MBL fold metallo-hydrolase [Occultella glacieicola]TDE88800.1 MBL fold metallo-hydrolase [Occultella glacieicola]